jgi:hypothetical protein
MMSTASLVAVGGELTKMRSAAPDPVDSGGITFAQSFGESVGLAVDLHAMRSGNGSSEMRGGENSGSPSSDAPFTALAAREANDIGDRRTTQSDETKSIAMASGAGNDLPAEVSLVVGANVSVRGKSKTTPGQTPANRGELQQHTGAKLAAQAGVSHTKKTAAAATIGSEGPSSFDEEKAVEVSSIASTREPAAGSKTVDSASQLAAAVAGQGLLLGGAAESTVSSETLSVAKALDVTAVKKTTRTQESAIGPKITSKTAGTIESEKVVGDTSNVVGVQGEIPQLIQLSAGGGVHSNEVGAATANAFVSGAIAGKPSPGASAGGTDSVDFKGVVGAAKDELEVTGQVVDPAAGMAEATGFGTEIAKTAAAASTAVKDADEKGLGAVGVVTSVHSVAGNEGTASGVAPGTAFGQVPSEVSGAKIQSGEISAHTATVQSWLGKQDDYGAAAAEMDMSHRTLVATPTSLEVGLPNGTQGWLKIRAEMTDGGVTASLSSASSSGHEMLHRELPSLTAYLQEERVPVNSVIVPAYAAAGTDSRATGGMNGEGSGHTQQGSYQERESPRQGSIPGTPDLPAEIPSYVALNGVGEDGLLSIGAYADGGSWLNVRA